MEILNFALENFNPPKAFDELENEGNEINPDYKQYVCDLTESVKQKIIHEKDDVVSQSLLEETENLF